MIAPGRQIDWKLLGICLGLILLSVATMPWWTVDDAFISYRYGKNWLETGRLTWNPSEPGLVEGYTGVLLPLLAATLLKAGVPLIDAIKLLGLLAAIGTVAFLMKGLRSVAVPKLATWLACILLAANPLLTMHALSGLETSFFTCFLIGSYVLAHEGQADNRPRQLSALLLAVMLLLCGLSRPEGIAWAAILAVALIRKQWPAATVGGRDRRWIAASLAVALLAAYWVWRWDYYGYFFPNSYHAKSYQGYLNPDSFIALAKFLLYYISLPLGLALYIGFDWKWKTAWNVFRSHRAMHAALLFIGIVAIMYLRSNLWMNYGSRFFFPYLPLLLLLITEHVRWDRVVPQHGRKRSVVVGLIVIQLAVLGFRHVQERAFLGYYSRIVEEELIPAGRYVHDHFPAGARVVSYMDAGALGYYSDREIVDFGRLSDVYLAQSKPTTQQAIDYFYACDPHALVMTSWLENEVNYTDEAMAIIGDPRFKSFRFVRSWGNKAGYPYWQRLYVKE